MHKFLAKTVFIGKQHVHLPKCHSTQKIMEEMLQKGPVREGTVVTTDDQYEGQGQTGNHWESAPGKNLTATILLKPQFLDIKDQFFLNVIASLSVYDLLTGFIPDGLSVKWPNDVMCKNRKIAGILIRNTLAGQKIEHAMAGIGLNINQESFTLDTATSLHMVTGKTYSRSQLLKYLLEILEKRYLLLREGNYDQLREEYYECMYGMGRILRFDDGTEFEGRITGFDVHGRLMIERVDGGLSTYNYKEVRYCPK